MNRPKINFRALRMTEDALTDEQRAYVHALGVRYAEKTSGSKRWAENNYDRFCDWINSLSFKLSLKEMIYPIISDGSKGSHFKDIDGNDFVDISMGYGAVFMGHNPDFQRDAISAQVEKGYELGPQLKLSAEVADLVCEMTGVERVAFCNSGTEAVMMALRMARAATGKNKIFIFRNSFHGTFDGVLGFTNQDGTFPVSPGTTDGTVADIELLDYGTDEAFERIKECIGNCAGVLVEPVQSRKPDLRPKEFLKKLRELTEANNTALIFDEVVTGFRLHPGGAQHIYGIKADIVTYGKSFGNGVPVSAVAGKKRFMDVIDGGEWRFGDASKPETDVVFCAGTYFKHPLSMAAAKAVLAEIKQTGTKHQDTASAQTEKMCSALNKWFDENKVPVNIKYFGSMFRFESFGDYALHLEPIEMELMFFNMMIRNVYTWERRICYLSSAHTDADVNTIIKAVKESVEDLRNGGFDFSVR
jgi:glutamate-1-semialdehyde aminotransferase